MASVEKNSVRSQGNLDTFFLIFFLDKDFQYFGAFFIFFLLFFYPFEMTKNKMFVCDKILALDFGAFLSYYMHI